jgi:hypothetical protein
MNQKQTIQEDVLTAISDLNLFEGIPSDFEVRVETEDNSVYISSLFYINLDVLKIFKTDYHNNVLWDVRRQLQNVHNTIRKYGILGFDKSTYSSIYINKSNVDVWKKTQLKKLKEFGKTLKDIREIHAIRVKYCDNDLYPTLQVVFKQSYGSYLSNRRVVIDKLKEHAYEVLGFNRNIRIDW